VRTVFVLRGEEVDTQNGVDNREEVLPAARKIRQAGRALPHLTFLAHNRLRAHDLFYARRVIIQESAAQKVSEFYAALAGRKRYAGAIRVKEEAAK
jgi:ribosomal protein L4